MLLYPCKADPIIVVWSIFYFVECSSSLNYLSILRMIKYKHEYSSDIFILHDCSFIFFFLNVKDPSNLFENIS